ncbi:MAG: hypothetical protein AB8B81_00030 [Halioglobus sp.]
MPLDSSDRLLFVLGMHRSGTSAMCAALDACNVSFGDNLLDPMHGVNDEGFWEDLELVRINEQILRLLDLEWYTVRMSQLLRVSWSDQRWSELRVEGRAFLQRGVSGGHLEALKDPRLCITLPFWLMLCDELGIKAHLYVTSRAPIDIAKSLQKRDGFPIGFGLRLYATYRKLINASVPTDTIFVSYNELIDNPSAVMTKLSQAQPLTINSGGLNKAVRRELRHQTSEGSASLLNRADSGDLDLQALDDEIERFYPEEELLSQLVETLVERGQELSVKGLEFEQSLNKVSEQHITALKTLDERDTQISELTARLDTAGEHLANALAVIPERDSQIEELDRRLETIGAEHSYALEVINERDQQVQLLDQLLETRQKMFELPIIGRVFRKLWFREEG